MRPRFSLSVQQAIKKTRKKRVIPRGGEEAPPFVSFIEADPSLPRPIYRQNQFGTSIGGPVHKSGLQIAADVLLHRQTKWAGDTGAARDGVAVVARDRRSGKQLFKLTGNLDAEPSPRFGRGGSEALDPKAQRLVHPGADGSTLWLRPVRGRSAERRLFRNRGDCR